MRTEFVTERRYIKVEKVQKTPEEYKEVQNNFSTREKIKPGKETESGRSEKSAISDEDGECEQRNVKATELQSSNNVNTSC